LLQKIILFSVVGTVLYSDTFSFTLENDFFGSKEDDHYTNGVSLIWMQDSDQSGKFDFILDGLQTNSAFSFTHQIFTPIDKESTEPILNDLPYAGYAKFNFLLYKSSKNYFHEFGINFGAVGPITHAEQIQSFFHKIVGDGKFKGWNNQLDNHFMAGLSYQFAYKSDSLDIVGYKLDAIGNIYGEVGNFYTGALTSFTLRLSSEIPETFVTAGTFLVTDESELLHMKKRDEFNWNISFGVFANLVHNYYIIDEGIDIGYILEPIENSVGWQAAMNMTYDNWRYSYKIKSSHVNDWRHKRWGGMTISWSF